MADNENNIHAARDIDAVIRAVRQQMPSVKVAQWQKVRANDDDNLWWFALPGVKRDVQVENASCPILIETDEQCCKQALKATTVQEAVTMIVTYLTAASEGLPCHLEGNSYWLE